MRILIAFKNGTGGDSMVVSGRQFSLEWLFINIPLQQHHSQTLSPNAWHVLLANISPSARALKNQFVSLLQFKYRPVHIIKTPQFETNTAVGKQEVLLGGEQEMLFMWWWWCSSESRITSFSHSFAKEG